MKPKRPPPPLIVFTKIIFTKDKRKIEEKLPLDTNSQLKNFCNQKNIKLILNGNLKQEHLGVNKLHLNRKGDSAFAKNLLNFIERN